MGFWCITEAWPDAIVQWFKGNVSQPGSQKQKMFIPVSPNTPPDIVYTCVAENKVGRTTENVTLQGTYIATCILAHMHRKNQSDY